MKRSMKIERGALLTAMLLTSVTFADTATPSNETKNSPKDLPERVLLGLNGSELQDKNIPDFGPEVFEKIKQDPNVIETRGKIPRYTTDSERRSWLDKLDKIRIGVQEDMSPYRYPNGSVISDGFDWEGYFYVKFYKNATVNTSLVNEIYGIIDKDAKVRDIQEIPVVFSLEDMSQLDFLILNNSNKNIPKPENRTTTPSTNKDMPTSEVPGKPILGFGLLGGLIALFSVWLFRGR